MKRSDAVYSLGTSTRSKAEFARVLQRHGIAVIIDVRRFPTSRIQHFNQQALVQLLADAHIEYVHLGENLGGYRNGGYRAFTATSEFRQGIDIVERAALKRRIAILCAERLPWRCHRRFITAELEKRGWHVEHIIDEEQSWLPGEPS